jgi:hypothetical protein
MTPADCHNRMDAASNIEITHHLYVPGLHSLDQVIEDLIGDFLMKSSFVAVTP